VDGALILDIVIGKHRSVFKLFSSKDQALLIRGDSLFGTYFGFNFLNCVTGSGFQADGFTGQSFDEDLSF